MESWRAEFWGPDLLEGGDVSGLTVNEFLFPISYFYHIWSILRLAQTKKEKSFDAKLRSYKLSVGGPASEQMSGVIMTRFLEIQPITGSARNSII